MCSSTHAETAAARGDDRDGNQEPVGRRRTGRSIARTLPELFLRGQALIDAIDAAGELVEPLAVVLDLAGCGLRFGQGGLGGRVGLLQALLERVDALADRRDLLADIGLGRTAAQADRSGQKYDHRREFRHRDHHLLSSNR